MPFWRRQPMQKNYVSDLDRFLHEYDQKPEASSSARRVEEAKHERIRRLRDQKTEGSQDSD